MNLKEWLRMKKGVILIVISLSCVFASMVQAQTLTAEKVMERMDTQVSLFPQEKLHLHLDRTSFFQGEKVWFKAYLTDAFLRPSQTGSRYVYVELINPEDSVVQRVMICPEEELFHGNLPLAEDLIEGTYTLRAYTRYMENMGEDVYFRQPIQVNSVIASQIRPHYTLDYQWDKRKVNIELYYTVGYSTEKVKPDKLQLSSWRGFEQRVRMDKDTVARFDYDLPSKGEYQPVIPLQADNFKHFIPLANAADDYDVSFYPEGGYLINGALTRVAFKAVNSAGLAEEVEGTIYNSQGEYRADLKTVHGGMGLLGIVANEEESYYLECVNKRNLKKRFDLPKGISHSYGLQTNRKDENLLVSVVHPEGRSVPNDLYLLIHQNGEVYFFDTLSKKRKELIFSWDLLPQGLLQVMLLDKDLKPLSERLVFSPLKEETQLRMKTDKPAYPMREKIALEMELTDQKGMPLAGHFSLAVTDSRDVEVDSLHSIASTLLLTTELKGHIEDPAYYFRKDDPETQYALDLLLMTQGWRRYDIPQALHENYAHPSILPEMGLTISGRVTQIDSKKTIANGEVIMMLTGTDEESYIDQTTTNEEGLFLFDRMEYTDSTKLFLHSLNAKGKDYVQIHMDDITYPRTGLFDRNKVYIEPEKEELIAQEENPDHTLQKAEKRAMYDENMQVVNLKEVFVTAKKIEKKQGPDRSAYASSFTPVIDFEKKMETRHYSSVSDAFYEIAGVDVTRDGEGNSRLVIRGGSSLSASPYAMILVDGSAVNDPAILDVINVYDIATIEVFKGADAAIFGMQGGNGAVNIQYKTGASRGDNPTFNKLVKTMLGVQRPAEFYAPTYETPQKKSSYLPDLRTTVYWKPNIRMDEEGKARLEFYSADTPTVYDVVVEGLTTDGMPIRKVEKIRVE